MKLRLPLLLATALLVSGLSACSKADDPQAEPPASNTGTYTLDGKARYCKAAQEVFTGSGYDYLSIALTTTPQPSSGEEKLILTFRKPTGQSNAAYELMPIGSLLLYSGVSSQPLDFQHKSPLPIFTGNNVSGTFSGEMRSSPTTGASTIVHTITGGTYKHVRR